jgi:PEP-CTERM motif
MRLFWAAFVSALALPMYADAVFTLGNHPQGDEQNVLFTADQSGAFITGVTNNTGTIVDFWSTTDVLIATAKGQANVTAEDGLLNDISIGLAGGVGVLDLILDPSAATQTSSGKTTVTAHMNDGSTNTFTYAGDLGNGQNYLTVTTSGGELITSVTIDSDLGFDTLRQVRISGINGSVPEPGSMALIGGGLLLLAPSIRRWRRA